MKYFSLNSILDAFTHNAEITSNKFWGLLGILCSVNENIIPGKTYSFNTGITSQFLEDLFCFKDKRNYLNIHTKYYVMFSNVWVEKMRQQMCSSSPNFVDVAIWFLRNEPLADEFTEKPNIEYLIKVISGKTGLTFEQIKSLFQPIETNLNITFSESKVSDSILLSELSNKYGNDKGYSSISAEGSFIKANPGEFARAPFIQTIYASQQSTECLFLTQFPIPAYYSQECDQTSKKVAFLKEPLQLIYYGAPGTGKSFSIDAATNEDNSVRTTFHPDSDYASFVGTYKPTMAPMPINAFVGTTVHHAKNADNEKAYEKKIVYKYVPQAFMKAYVEAWKRYTPDEDVPYYLVIEEINRGNCAQIFGDLFQLLDRNNQGCSSYAISADEDIAQFLRDDENGFAKLSEDQRQAISSFVLVKDSGKEEHIGHSILNGSKLLLPPNLRIWATMNTSDQSLFPIDSAFKRRWNWKYMPIDYNPIDNRTGKPIDWKFQIGDALYSWGEFLGKINPEIYTLTESSDKQMGYFFAKADPSTEVISEEVFLNKVLFYLWTDVFKDYDVSSEIFRNEKKNRSFIFTDFFDKEQPTALVDFIGNLKLTPIDDDDELSSDDKHSRLTVTLPDGSILNTGNMTDIYVDALKNIGLDRVAETLGDMKKGKYPLITKELIPIENPASKRRYRKEGDYYILVGPDTYPYADTLNDISKRLSISLHADFE